MNELLWCFAHGLPAVGDEYCAVNAVVTSHECDVAVANVTRADAPVHPIIFEPVY